MTAGEVLELFKQRIPDADYGHILCYFSRRTHQGDILPFVQRLIYALSTVDDVSPGYADEMINRIANIPGCYEDSYEALLSVLAEVYVTCGAVEVADSGLDGHKLFMHEPKVRSGKNPEFESRHDSVWYAVEVKSPKLIAHGRTRGERSWQVSSRIPSEIAPDLIRQKDTTLPRDNPIKDFLVSANQKFEQYASIRPEAYRILTIVWDDFCYEPISALCNPMSGLLTDASFYRDASGSVVSFPYVDGIVVCRYRHQLQRATREEPLADGETLFHYHNPYALPKAYITNPAGREVPPSLLLALSAFSLESINAAEYSVSDIITWW